MKRHYLPEISHLVTSVFDLFLFSTCLSESTSYPTKSGASRCSQLILSHAAWDQEANVETKTIVKQVWHPCGGVLKGGVPPNHFGGSLF